MIRVVVGEAGEVRPQMWRSGLRSCAGGFLWLLQGHRHGDGRYGDCHYGSGDVHGSGGRAVAAPYWLP